LYVPLVYNQVREYQRARVLYWKGTSMVLKVIVKKGEAGYYVARCPALKGCWSQGKSEQEALDNIKEAIEGWLEVEEEKVGKALHGATSIHSVKI